jgi:hypothetical protein
MTFQQAVQSTPSLANHYRRGLQALSPADATRVRCKATRRLTGSVNIDGALASVAPNANRWDYGIGLRRGGSEVAVWVEVHPASSKHIDEVLRKLQWLRNFLQNHAPALGGLTQGDYYWLSTDAPIAITPNSPQAKRLAKAGLIGPRRVLHLA